MWQTRLTALLVLLVGIGIGYFVYHSEIDPSSRFHFRLGLDLVGGSHLVYKADTSSLGSADIPGSMDALREVIERRVNLFGVSEPLVQVEEGSAIAGSAGEHRLIVELPGVTDIQEAIKQIGQTPVLEFKLIDPASVTSASSTPVFITTGLTGRYLTKAQIQFQSGKTAGALTNEPMVLLTFNSEGGDLFAKITRENTGKQLAIFLDGQLISSPVIREEIAGGQATISGGNMTAEQARDLAKNLNFGALPVPIELVSTQTIGATLGNESLQKGLHSGIVGMLAVILFMILWYRLPGIMATFALSIYVAIMLSIFKLMPVTLTAAGIAGFILSIGMAVDANIIIFERLKEELRHGKDLPDAIQDGFARAWLAIRDGHVTSIISAIILFWFGTSLIQGFALTFGIGVIVSLFSAITLTRVFLRGVGNIKNHDTARILFGSGIKLK